MKKFSIIDYVSGWCSDEEFNNLITFIKNLPKNDDNQLEKQSLIPQKVLEELRIEIISQLHWMYSRSRVQLKDGVPMI